MPTFASHTNTKTKYVPLRAAYDQDGVVAARFCRVLCELRERLGNEPVEQRATHSSLELQAKLQPVVLHTKRVLVLMVAATMATVIVLTVVL
jgi:hypothetical protein